MPDKVGQQLGNYRLISLLGEGGFARVYLGEHIYLSTQAAIKVLNTQLTSDNVEWFRTEARTIARLVHPNIVRVLDYGVDAMTPFLVLDYAPNGSLGQQHPRGTSVALPTIISYVKQVADALQYAHDEKLIHRDVKPENMLLGRRKEVLLSDFGLALIAQSTRYQNVQNVAGTLSYMAPEQIQGKPRPASDQYSLGVVVYEWLSGEALFQGSLSEIISQQLAVPPPPLRSKVPRVPPAVERVVMTALEKDPKKRFGSLREFALALEQASQADTLISEQVGTPVVPRVDETSQQATFPPLRRITAPVASEPTLPPAPFLAPMAQTEPPGTIVCSYRGHLTSVRSLSWSPNAIVSASGDETVHVWDTTLDREILAYRHSAPVYAVAWSPDGKRFAFASDDKTVQVWDTITNLKLFTFQHTAPVRVMAWSLDGKYIASGGDDATIQVWVAP